MARLGDTRKRARSAGTGTTGAERRNVRCVSTGEGMSSMANSMNTAADTLANAMREVATTLCPTDVTVNPTQHATFDTNTNVPAAIALIEENKDLSNDEFSDATECITRNPMIATVYIAMSNQNSRSRYIRKQVDSYRGLEAA